MKRPLAMVLPLLLLLAVGFILLVPARPPAPAFRLQTLEGQTVSEVHLQGKVTLINFWFPSCPGCVSEMPKLIRMAEDYRGKNFQILAVSLAKPDSLNAVRQYAERNRLPFAVLYDAEGRTEAAYAVKAAPTSFLVGTDGRIVKTYVGEPESFPDLYREVDRLLQP